MIFRYYSINRVNIILGFWPIFDRDICHVKAGQMSPLSFLAPKMWAKRYLDKGEILALNFMYVLI